MPSGRGTVLLQEAVELPEHGCAFQGKGLLVVLTFTLAVQVSFQDTDRHARGRRNFSARQRDGQGQPFIAHARELVTRWRIVKAIEEQFGVCHVIVSVINTKLEEAQALQITFNMGSDKWTFHDFIPSSVAMRKFGISNR